MSSRLLLWVRCDGHFRSKHCYYGCPSSCYPISRLHIFQHPGLRSFSPPSLGVRAGRGYALLIGWTRGGDVIRTPHLACVLEGLATLLPTRVMAAAVNEALPSCTGNGAELDLLLALQHRACVRGAVDPAVLHAALEVAWR